MHVDVVVKEINGDHTVVVYCDCMFKGKLVVFFCMGVYCMHV